MSCDKAMKLKRQACKRKLLCLKCFSLFCQHGSLLQGKKIPRAVCFSILEIKIGTNSLEMTPFQKGLGVQESKSKKLCPFERMAENQSVFPFS